MVGAQRFAFSEDNGYQTVMLPVLKFSAGALLLDTQLHPAKSTITGATYCGGIPGRWEGGLKFGYFLSTTAVDPFDPLEGGYFDLSLFTQQFVTPAVEVVRVGLLALMDEVGADPGRFRKVLSSLMDDDREIYDHTFNKSINSFQKEQAYKAMLAVCHGKVLGGPQPIVNAEQPTSDLVTLVLQVRKRIDPFKLAIDAVTAGVDGVTTCFRPHDETKSPYRVIEKAFTKGPLKDPTKPIDCSLVLDLFGCLINCTSFDAMGAVLSNVADLHHDRGGGGQKTPTLRVSRVKNRWTEPSGGGWRDVMINVVIEGYVFEVQLVLHGMLVARKALDAHAAYNQFRCFAEVFALLRIPLVAPPTALGPACSTSTGGGNIVPSGGGGTALDNDNEGSAAALVAKIQDLESKIEELVAKQVQTEARCMALEAENGALRATHTATGGNAYAGADRPTTASSSITITANQTITSTDGNSVCSTATVKVPTL